MYISKVIPIVLLFVSCSAISNDGVYNKRQVSRLPPRPYNRQPSEPKVAEDISDSIDNREGKSFDTEVNTSNANVLPENQDKDEKSTIITLTSGFEVKSSNTKQKSISEDNLKIPVAVIYEEPVTPRTQKKILRRKKPNKQITSVKDINTTIKPVSTEPEYKTTTSRDVNVISQKPTIATRLLENDTTDPKKSRERDPVIPIIQSENRVFGHNGNFHYSYEGGDGTKAFEKGELKTFEDDKTGEAVVGGFSYTAKDGQDYSLSYTADENGYRPVGAHLPTPPPIPPAIERALRYLATKSTPEPVTDSLPESV